MKTSVLVFSLVAIVLAAMALEVMGKRQVRCNQQSCDGSCDFENDQVIRRCKSGCNFKKCTSSSTYIYCDGTSHHVPTIITCPTGTYCGCDGVCNSTFYSNPCIDEVQPIGSGGDLPTWPTGPYTSVFIGNSTMVTASNTIQVVIPAGQLWADGNGKIFAEFHQAVNGAAVEKFKLLLPSGCEFSGDAIARSCAMVTNGNANDFLLGLTLPSTTVLVSTIISPNGDTLEVYQNTQGCPFNPPTSSLCLQETWVYDATTGHFTSYTRSETGVGYTSVEKIDFLWVVETSVNANLFIKPVFCNSNCP